MIARAILELRRKTEPPELQVARDYLTSEGYDWAATCEPWEMVYRRETPLLGEALTALRLGLGKDQANALRAYVFGSHAPEDIYRKLTEGRTRAFVRSLSLRDIAATVAAHAEVLRYCEGWGLDPRRAVTLVDASAERQDMDRDWLRLAGVEEPFVRRGRGFGDRCARINLAEPRKDDPTLVIVPFPYEDREPLPRQRSPWLPPPPGYAHEPGKGAWSPNLRRRLWLPDQASPLPKRTRAKR